MITLPYRVKENDPSHSIEVGRLFTRSTYKSPVFRDNSNVSYIQDKTKK